MKYHRVTIQVLILRSVFQVEIAWSVHDRGVSPTIKLMSDNAFLPSLVVQKTWSFPLTITEEISGFVPMHREIVNVKF